MVSVSSVASMMMRMSSGDMARLLMFARQRFAERMAGFADGQSALMERWRERYSSEL